MTYDIIVFLNSVFVRPHLNEKPVFSKSPFSKISGYLWMGPESLFVCFFSDVPFVKWMTFSLNMSHAFLVTRE